MTILVEKGLEPSFKDVHQFYYNVYRNEFIIETGGTSRTLVNQVSQDTAVIITRSLLSDELKLFAADELLIDTLGFADLCYDSLTIAGDINYGYNYLFMTAMKREWKADYKLQPTYRTGIKCAESSFRFPLVFVSKKSNRKFEKFLSFFTYGLPNTIFKKHLIVPAENTNRTIILDN